MAVNFQAIVGASVSRAQVDLPLRAGQVWMRGDRLAFVLDVTPGVDELTWVAEEEGEVTSTHALFRARALEAVELLPAASYLDRAWSIARSVQLPAADRLLALRAMLRRAPSPEEAAQVTVWMGELSQGRQPSFASQ